LARVDTALRAGAAAHRFGTDLWTLPRVATVIERLTGIHYHPGHVWYVLRRLNWSVQRPARRARERWEAAAEAARRVLMVAEQFHFMPAFRRLKGLLDDGAVGALREIHLVARGHFGRSGWRLQADLAGGGALIAVVIAIQPEMGQVWTFKSFLVIVLGGAGNYPGALLGGLLLGLVEQLASLFLTTQLSEVVAYLLLVVVLLLRPSGLLSGRQT